MLVLVFIALNLVNASGSSDEAAPAGVAGSPPAVGAAGKRGLSCKTKLASFVTELDALLDSRPRYIDPFIILLKKYFPLIHCDIDEAIAICSQSKYAMPVRVSARYHGFAFNSRTSNYTGYIVSFGLQNETGNSEYPSFKSWK
ncbi:MAG: hypothetical protein ACLPKB_13165 [Xanthobacteraceae bacterium]